VGFQQNDINLIASNQESYYRYTAERW